jgi:large subunit ribosomal protein L9
VEALRRARGERELKERSGAEQLAEKLKASSVAIAVKTGEGGRMFGAVTAADLHAKLVEKGIEIDRKRIHLYTPIKTLGRHTTTVKLHADVSVELEFDIVSENPIVESSS